MKSALKTLPVGFVVLAIISFTYFQGCKKHDQPAEPEPPATDEPLKIANVSGKLILPTGLPLNPADLQVHSPVAVSSPNSTGFTVSCLYNNPNTILITDKQGKAILMGYNLPGISQGDISVESTALAMVMNTPFAGFFSTEGKTGLVAKVKSLPSFSDLKKLVEQNLLSGKDLFDENNEALYDQLILVLKSLSLKNLKLGLLMSTRGNISTAPNSPPGATTFLYSPASLSKSGKVLTFDNTGTAIYATAVGIYKENKLEKSFIIPGKPAVSLSLDDYLVGKASKAIFGVKIPRPVSYTMQQDGEYTVRMRTGRPSASDNSPEYEQAKVENVINIANYALQLFIPIDVKGKAECFSETSKLILEKVKLDHSEGTVDEIFGYSVKHLQTLATCLGFKPAEGSFFAKISDFYKGFSKGLSRAGSVANLTFYAGQWLTVSSSFDTCYSVSGDAVMSCKALVSTSDIKDADLGSVSITAGGVTAAGHGYDFKSYGLCWSKVNTLPTLKDSFKEQNGNQAIFTMQIFELSPLSDYYLRAYVTLGDGSVFYGETKKFRTRELQIGDVAYGGSIFYLDATRTHGLVASTMDIGKDWHFDQIYPRGVVTSDEIGSGMANTLAIMRAPGIFKSPGLCRNYREGGYDDWYLPSLKELGEFLNANQKMLNFSPGYYGSSSLIYRTTDNYGVLIASGIIPPFPNGPGNFEVNIRAVRSF